MRVLVVTSMYPAPAHPGLGGFVRDQVEALQALEGVEVELFAIEPGPPTRFIRAARDLRRKYGGERFDVVHAHHGLTGWSALAVRGAPRVLTFHGTDLSHPIVGPLSRGLAWLVDLPAPVSASLARLPGGGLPGGGLGLGGLGGVGAGLGGPPPVDPGPAPRVGEAAAAAGPEKPGKKGEVPAPKGGVKKPR